MIIVQNPPFLDGSRTATPTIDKIKTFLSDVRKRNVRVTTSVSLEFGDGEYCFWLRYPQIIDLERKIGGSILGAFDRLTAGRVNLGDGTSLLDPSSGSASIDDVRETMRLGLIGGDGGVVNGELIKMTPRLALQLVESYGPPERPMEECTPVAMAILYAAIFGMEAPDVGADGTANDQPDL